MARGEVVDKVNWQHELSSLGMIYIIRSAPYRQTQVCNKEPCEYSASCLVYIWLGLYIWLDQ